MKSERIPSEECALCQSSTLLPLLLKEGKSTAAFAVSRDSVLAESFDWTLFQRGQIFFKHYIFNCFVGHLIGLISLLSVGTVLDVLMMTGQSSTSQRAYDRYFNTLFHLKHWYEADSWPSKGTAKDSMEEVRKKHEFNQKVAVKQIFYQITQTDMVLTQWAFVGPLVLRHQKLGIKSTSVEGLEGFIYFWKTIGYLVGIDDKFNLCRGTPKEVYADCHAILHQIIHPQMTNPPQHFKHMSNTLTNGTSKLIPPLNPEAFIHYTYEVLEIPLPSKSHTKWQFTCKVWLLEKGYHYPIVGEAFRIIFNFLLRLAISCKVNIDKAIRYRRWFFASLSRLHNVGLNKLHNAMKEICSYLPKLEYN